MSAGETGNKPYHLLTVDELRALSAHRQGRDTTPLTPAEQADLRRRLNAPGGASLRLPHRERAARWEMGIIRWPEDVQALYERVMRDLAENERIRSDRILTEFGQGIAAAIEWATGRGGTAPLSGDPSEEIPPPATQMSRETALGSDIAAGRQRHPRGRDYAVGVEHTLLWLRALTDEPPW